MAGRKIVLHFLPPYCPHLDPIERLWGLMHENVTHNRDYKTFAEFRREVIKFLRHPRAQRPETFPRPNHGQFSRHPSIAPIFGFSRSRGLDGEDLRLAGFQIDRAVDVEPLAAGRRRGGRCCPRGRSSSVRRRQEFLSFSMSRGRILQRVGQSPQFGGLEDSIPHWAKR
jgi:hypothetical protein